MSIRFVCACGQHLRAHDEHAARRSVCPVCGRPVGIPSLEPTQRGTEAEPISLTDHPQRLENAAAPSVPADDFLRYRVVALPDDGVPVVPVKIPRDEELTYRVVPLAEETLPPADRPHQPRVLEAEFSHDGTPDRAGSRWGRVLDTDIRIRRKRRDRRRDREDWQLERHWFAFLVYPFRAWLILGGLAFAFALLVSQAALLLPVFQEQGPIAIWPVLFLAGFALVLIGYTCGFWLCTVTSAVTGEAGFVRWPGKDFLLVLQSVLRCGACFLAGPAVLATAGFLYWYEYGDPEWIDQLVLGELIFVAAGYWLLSFVAVTERNGLAGVTPLSVWNLIRRLKLTALVAALGLSIVVGAHGAWTIDALTELHRNGFAGWFSLLVCWFNTLFWITFLLRWLGVSSFCTRVQAVTDARRSDTISGKEKP